jgi:two-component system sensor kinase FixL
LLRDLRSLAAGDARLHGIDLTLALNPDIPIIYCDAVQIQQVALNLVRNAVDAMFEIECVNGNGIELRSGLVGDYISVSVVDNGPGVDDSQTDKIFTPFHTTKRDGMGMGLSICRSIVEDHDGQLDYRNNSNNVGATFFFTLPIGDKLD